MLFVSCAAEGRYYWAGNGDFAMITAASAMKINASISDAKITGEEVRLVVFQMYPTKAPRVDGMPALFNKKIWDTIGYNVTAARLKYLNEGAVLDKINHTLITLIPKVTTAQRVSNFRPISLCNIIYKSVANALTNRFRLVLGGMISENQNVVLPGHLITDNAIISFECSYLLRKKKFVSLSFLVNGKPARFIKSSKDYAKVIPCTHMAVPISYFVPNQTQAGVNNLLGIKCILNFTLSRRELKSKTLYLKLRSSES
ncbi:hypothetical protein ACOSQ3_020803 [Xanthoceras sorbifolium]